ncbi:MAG: glycosyltransferase [Ardenticatenia bacterium]|nr:glycosyltransferase [Ardenticatenia bacterium]
MHILHVYKDYAPVLGGIENHIRLLAEGQVRRGHRVTVMVTNPKGWRTEEEVLNGVRVIRASRLATVASAPISVSLAWSMRRLSCDVVHAHFPYPVGEVAQWLFAPRRVCRVLTYHSDVVRQQGWLRLYAPLMYRVLSQMDAILATSPPYAESSPVLRRFRDRVHVVPLGIALSRFLQAPAERVAAWQARLTPHNTPLLLFVGRLRYYKGLDVLLRALLHVKQGTLAVVGDGPMGTAWKRLADELGLTSRVRFLGEVPDSDLPALYHAADLFVLPASARSEAFGTVLVEAMAAGLPLITTEVGTGTSWVNQHGITGLVVPPHDPMALANAINTLLGAPERREAMGEAGRRRALEEFNAERMVERVLTIYSSRCPGGDSHEDAHRSPLGRHRGKAT